MSRLLWIGAGAGGVAWVMWRLDERKRLHSMLRHDPLVTTLFVNGLIPWSPEEKAAQMITFADAGNAEDAFIQVQKELPALPRSVAEQWSEQIEEQTGVDMSTALDKLSKWVPGLGYAEHEEPTWGEWLGSVAG